jgi:hypothetical protein
LFWTNYKQYVNQIFSITATVHQSIGNSHDDAAALEEADKQNSDVTDDNDIVHLASPEPELDEIVISADNNGDHEICTPYMQDYLLHGNELSHLSLWEYTAMIQKIRKKKIGSYNQNIILIQFIQTTRLMCNNSGLPINDLFQRQ